MNDDRQSRALRSGLSVDEFKRRLLATDLIPAERVAAILEGLPAAVADGQQLAELLTTAKWLTNYQARAILESVSSQLVLNNYILVDELGTGGMGHVFRAIHRRMERVVAIKVLPPDRMPSPTSVARFHREVKAAARLVHPNVVTAFDADEAGSTHYLVMEYVDGCDLSRLLKQQGPLTVNQAIHCVIQAAEGLAAAHDNGIFHRDVKPGNLLVDRQGVVKVLDLGLAQFDSQSPWFQSERLTVDGQILGTTDFISPEQIASPELIDARSDIYSLGCTLYALLTGDAMYGSQTTGQKLVAHQSRDVPSLREQVAEVPLRLEGVYQRMVAKSPADRPASMRQVISELSECFIANQPRSVQPPPNTMTIDLNEYLYARASMSANVPTRDQTTKDTVRIAATAKGAGANQHAAARTSAGDNQVTAAPDCEDRPRNKPRNIFHRTVAALFHAIKRRHTR